MVPKFMRRLIQSCINILMKAVLYGKYKLVTGNKDHKKMICNLYGTEIVDIHRPSINLEEGKRLTQYDGETTSVVQFSLPDNIMIMFYERDKEYVYTF